MVRRQDDDSSRAGLPEEREERADDGRRREGVHPGLASGKEKTSAATAEGVVKREM